jgi:hypothetical protein
VSKNVGKCSISSSCEKSSTKKIHFTVDNFKQTAIFSLIVYANFSFYFSIVAHLNECFEVFLSLT